MTWDHRISKIAPIVALLIGTLGTVVAFAAYYH